MISTVTISRTSKAKVAVEHPDSWGQEEVSRAALARSFDLAERVSFWEGENRTALTGVEYDSDFRDELDEDQHFRPGPVVLEEDDLLVSSPPAADEKPPTGEEK